LARQGTQDAGRGCILGPLAQPSRRLPGLSHRTAGSPHSRHTSRGPTTSGTRTAHTHSVPRLASPRPYDTSHTYTPVLHHRYHAEPSPAPRPPHTPHHAPHARKSFRALTRPPRATAITRNPHAPTVHTSPFLQLPGGSGGRPFPQAQTSGSFSLPGRRKAACPAGRAGGGGHGRRPNTAALSHPVAWGGADLEGRWGPLSAEPHAACGLLLPSAPLP
jgi:hypothetical protein